MKHGMLAVVSWGLGLVVPHAVARGQGALDDPLPDIPSGSNSVKLEDVTDTLMFPLTVADPGDGSGRLFVNTNDGRTRIVVGGNVLPTPFLELPRTQTFNGTAMSGLAFHPDFAADEAAGVGGRVYVAMTEDPGSGPADFGAPGEVHQSVLYEVRASVANPDIVRPGSIRAVLRINESSTIHNIDDIAFGPDGYLYVSKGDDQDGGQDTTTVNGKVLRIDVDRRAGNPLAANGEYAVPADNPFVGDASGLDEIWAYGFRNPWRLGFDRATGALYVADVGERDIEEVNVVELAADGSAQNYGWPEKEGSFRYLGFNNGVTDDLSGLPAGIVFVDPVGEYDHGQNNNSITGGVLYRGTLLPELVGQYVFGDWISGQLFQLDVQTGAVRLIAYDPAGESVHGQPPFAGGQPPEGILAVREDAQGELLLVVSQRNLSDTGRIVRVVPPECAQEMRCVSTPNSSGSAALIQGTGSTSVAANDFGLSAGPVPAQVPGLFFYGRHPIQVPFGDGFRCTGGQVVRVYPLAFSGAAGVLTTTLDNLSPRHDQIGVGVTLQFQAWFRDGAAGGAGFNLSNALSARFCP